MAKGILSNTFILSCILFQYCAFHIQLPHGRNAIPFWTVLTVAIHYETVSFTLIVKNKGFVTIMSKSELKLYFHLKNTSYIFSHMSHVSVLGKSSYEIPSHRVECCTACRRVPRKLPNLVARRLESVIEKVMSSASNVEKVEKRGKYLKTMVGSGKDSSCYTLSRYCPASPLNLPNFTCNDCSGRS